MAKRKVDSEYRAFQNRWEAEYMFTDIAGKPVCLICGANVAVIKEFNHGTASHVYPWSGLQLARNRGNIGHSIGAGDNDRKIHF